MSSKLSRILGRMAMQGQLIVQGHILNPLWRERNARRKCRYDATLKSALRYLRRYSSQISTIKAAPQPKVQDEPERAFTIWFQGEENAPELVKACFRSMRKHLRQELVVLDEKTLFDWITLPDYVVRKWKEGIIPHTQFSDICRVALLYEHGGLWFDATDFITEPVPQWIMDEDFFIFMAGEKIRGSYAFIQSCFIRGRKGNPLLGIWLEADCIYWKNENSRIDYFVHHLLFKLATEVNCTARELIGKMPHVDQDPTHALWGEHCMEPYSEQAFRKLTGGSFFQKTNYKDKRLHGDISGTMAEHIISNAQCTME